MHDTISSLIERVAACKPWSNESVASEIAKGIYLDAQAFEQGKLDFRTCVTGVTIEELIVERNLGKKEKDKETVEAIVEKKLKIPDYIMYFEQQVSADKVCRLFVSYDDEVSLKRNAQDSCNVPNVITVIRMSKQRVLVDKQSREPVRTQRGRQKTDVIKGSRDFQVVSFADYKFQALMQ